MVSVLDSFTELFTKRANTYVSCAVTGFFSAFLNTLFFMTALIVMFGNTELIRNLMGGHNIIVGCCLMVGVNAISEMVSSTIITAAVGTALSKAHLIPAVQIVKIRYCSIKSPTDRNEKYDFSH